MSKHGGIGEYGSDMAIPVKIGFAAMAQQLASLILVEIHNDPELRACATVEALHAICDANTLGDTESVLADPDYGMACVLVAQAIVSAQLIVKIGDEVTCLGPSWNCTSTKYLSSSTRAMSARVFIQ